MSAGGRRIEIVRAGLWAVRLHQHQPGAGVEPGYSLGEASCAEADELAQAMSVRPEVAVRRFLHGSRAWAARSPQGAIAAWLWVSVGRQRAEPIGRTLVLAPDEAYGWDAGTLATHRRRGLFTSLLEAAGGTMRCEGRTVMWGGIHDHNVASRRANIRAGFWPVLRMSVLRLGQRGLIRTHAVAYADPDLVERAYRLLTGGGGAIGRLGGA